MSMITRDLAEGWQLKQSDAQEWLPVARIPSSVHLDLMANNIINDPFIDFNERDCQWVGEKSWTYRTSFDLPSTTPGMRKVLAFDGLDTYATVTLNGKTILRADNMFVMHRVDVTDIILSSGANSLEIEFNSALLLSQKWKRAHPDHKWVGSNGDMARLAARKAQYHYGWDWGPVLISCGPWRPIRLELYSARIADLRIEYEVSPDLDSVRGYLTVVVEGKASMANFNACIGRQEVFCAAADIDASGEARVEFYIGSPKLWHPHGYGEQNLYNITASLKREDQEVLHSVVKRTGFRRGELVQEPDDTGKSFYFRFNNVDVFCGGSNWIPADSFTPRISKQKYRQLLTTLAESNQTMVRIWGGGIWEPDEFYELCDQLGILVWQDFMFACGNYPADSDILQSIQDEATCQVKRLRHHPSLALYAGNNEDYQIQEQEGLTYNFDDKDPQSWLKTDFPARYIYEKLLPDVVHTYSPNIPYHPGSPWGDGKRTSDPTVGDLHEWNVWHGTQERYQRYGSLGGRFNSEFGMEAFPDIKTIKSFVTDPSQLSPHSPIIDFHNKAAGHEERIHKYLSENFKVRSGLEDFVYLTQLCQAEAMSYAYKGWRKRWGQQRFCGGALVWQLNDCWPVTSWSIVDYYQRKKPAYYAIKRALAPVAIAVQRGLYDWSSETVTLPKRSRYECWVVSSRVKELRVKVELRSISIASGETKTTAQWEDLRIAANGTTIVFEGEIDNISDPCIIVAKLVLNGTVVSMDVDWPQPFKHLHLDDRGITVTQQGDRIVLETEKPTKGVVLEERDGVTLSDNLLDLIPGERRVIKCRGLKVDDRLRWTYLDAPGH